MSSNELHSKLIGFFDLDREEYHQSHSHIGIDEDKYLIITETAKKAIKTISSFTECDGYVPVDENNVVILWECIDALHICMYPRSSQYRESSILFTYQFLCNFHWTGKPAKYVGYNGWGPIIYVLSPEQLAYYLWWRKEAKCGIFHETTGEYL